MNKVERYELNRCHLCAEAPSSLASSGVYLWTQQDRSRNTLNPDLVR